MVIVRVSRWGKARLETSWVWTPVSKASGVVCENPFRQRGRGLSVKANIRVFVQIMRTCYALVSANDSVASFTAINKLTHTVMQGGFAHLCRGDQNRHGRQPRFSKGRRKSLDCILAKYETTLSNFKCKAYSSSHLLSLYGPVAYVPVLYRNVLSCPRGNPVHQRADKACT